VRVIAGALGGRRLDAPRGLDTRPTSDRVREAVFMALEPIDGLRFVDLFAGSGACGIEALSRGAAAADFVESSPAARRVLHANLEALGLDARAKVWALELPRGVRVLAQVLGMADVVMLDPPYRGDLAVAVLEALDAEGGLRAGVRVVVEHFAKRELPDRVGRLARRRTRRFGETAVTTYDVESADGSGLDVEEGA